MQITVVRGTGRGPTETAAYDAALVDAGVGDFNLVRVSSVVPADAIVTVADTPPDLGSPGERLTAVVSDRVAGPGDPEAVAGLGWTTGPGAGLFYEESGTDPAVVRERIETGLAAGRDLRDWSFTDEEIVLAGPTAPETGYAASVVVAAYGEGEPIG